MTAKQNTPEYPVPGYRDFAALYAVGAAINGRAENQGIPVYANLTSGYFEAVEVAAALSVLKVIDNPYQDIPLASVLRSPIVGCDENELALIRLEKKKRRFMKR